MASFTNFATLIYNGGTSNSNTVTGELRVLRAQDGILHYQRVGEAETAEVIVNRSEHIIVEPLASGKHTEVNPMGFTIVVEENGHNPNHSYYDIQ